VGVGMERLYPTGFYPLPSLPPVRPPDPGKASPDLGLHHPPLPGDGPTGEPRHRTGSGHARPCPREGEAEGPRRRRGPRDRGG
jgi:hypothetical protein